MSSNQSSMASRYGRFPALQQELSRPGQVYNPPMPSRVQRRLTYAHVVLATGFAILFFGTGTRYVFGLVLVPMTDDLHLSRSVLSSALLVYMIVSALTMPIVGRLIDRHSIRVVMAVGALLSALAITLMGAVDSAWQVFALYGVMYAIGFAASSLAPIAVLMSRWFPNNTGLASSAAITGNGTGQLVIIALLASFLPNIGWRWAYTSLGLINAVVVVPLILIFLRQGPVHDDGAEIAGPTSPSPISLATVLKARDFWLVTVMYIVCGFQDFFMATHVVAFAQDNGVSDFLAGNILAFMGLAALLGVLLSGVLADRYGASRPTLLCFVLRIALFAYIPFMQDTVSIAVVALVYGFSFTITAPLTVVFARNIFGTQRLGSVSGMFNMVHQVAGGLGALSGALIFDATGSYNRAFFLLLAMSVIAAVATLGIRERRHSALAAATG